LLKKVKEKLQFNNFEHYFMQQAEEI